MAAFTLAASLRPRLLRRSISTSPALFQEPQLQDFAPPPTTAAAAAATPLPPNPSTGSPLYQDSTWRTPAAAAAGLNSLLAQSLSPLGVPSSYPSPQIRALSQTLDGPGSLMNVFADWMTSQRWSDLKQLFEFWIRSLDKNGKPNKPDVSLYNHYLRAGLMSGSSAAELLDLVAQMDDYGISPNTASFNMVLKAMYLTRENEAAEKLVDR